MRQADLKGRLAQWALQLQSYKFGVSHQKGCDHIVPDGLPRMYSDEIALIERCGPEIDLNTRYKISVH